MRTWLRRVLHWFGVHPYQEVLLIDVSANRFARVEQCTRCGRIRTERRVSSSLPAAF